MQNAVGKGEFHEVKGCYWKKCNRLLIAHTYNFRLSDTGSVLMFLVRNCLCLYMVVNEGVIKNLTTGFLCYPIVMENFHMVFLLNM